MTSRSKGLLCAISAVSIFAVQDGISKYVGTLYSPVFIVMIRYWAFALFAIALASRAPGGVKVVAAANRIWLQIFRGVLLASQVVISIWSFRTVGLAATHSIFASAPLVVACLAVPILGEKVGWRRWAAIGVGFIGILLIANPLQATFDWKVIIPIIATLSYGLYAILTRLASRTDKSSTSFFYIGTAGCIVMTAIGPFFWADVAPGDWIWIGIVCITGISGHYLLIQALNLLDAVVVQPMSYIGSVLVCLIGVFVFGEVMTANMILGCAIVIAAGLYTIWREMRTGRVIQVMDPPASL